MHKKVHIYTTPGHGRACRSDPDSKQLQMGITCSKCGATEWMNVTKLVPPEFADKKFTQKRWKLDPNICPHCVEQATSERRVKRENHRAELAAEKESKPVTTTTNVSPLADHPSLRAASTNSRKAEAVMHRLLTAHFDPDNGAYKTGWSDERVSKESGLAPGHVVETRKIAYGEIKEPEDIVALRADLKAMHDMLLETMANAQKEMRELRERVDAIARKYGA